MQVVALLKGGLIDDILHEFGSSENFVHAVEECDLGLTLGAYAWILAFEFVGVDDDRDGEEETVHLGVPLANALAHICAFGRESRGLRGRADGVECRHVGRGELADRAKQIITQCMYKRDNLVELVPFEGAHQLCARVPVGIHEERVRKKKVET